MLHGHLQHKFRRDFKDLWILAISLQDQRQHIKAAIARLPAQVNAQLQERERRTESAATALVLFWVPAQRDASETGQVPG